MSDVKLATPQRRVDVPGRAHTVALTTVGGRIAWTRLSQKLTQQDLADKIKKARATVVQYENGIINPPIEVVEKLARVLDVEPEFLAFGRHGVGTSNSPSHEIVTVDEIRVGRDGEYASGGFAFNKPMMNDFGISEDEYKSLKVYVFTRGSAEFGMAPNTRLIVNTVSKDLTYGSTYFLVSTPSGLEVVRPEPRLKTGATVPFTGSTGQVFHYKVADLNFVGSIVGMMTPL